MSIRDFFQKHEKSFFLLVNEWEATFRSNASDKVCWHCSTLLICIMFLNRWLPPAVRSSNHNSSRHRLLRGVQRLSSFHLTDHSSSYAFTHQVQHTTFNPPLPCTCSRFTMLHRYWRCTDIVKAFGCLSPPPLSVSLNEGGEATDGAGGEPLSLNWMNLTKLNV